MALKGIDISEWQGNPDFNAIKGAGIDFVVIRNSFGTARADRSFAFDRDQARAAGLLRGYYHYAYPNQNNATAEANFFVAQLGQLQAGEILALDFEESYGDPVGWSLEWLNRVRDLLGVKPLLYINYALAKAHDWSPVINADYGLWLADWGTSSPPGTQWPFAALWQYADNLSVPGVGNVDADLFFGDGQTWAKYGVQISAPSPAVGYNTVDATVNVVVDSLNARTLPTTGSDVVAAFHNGPAHINGWTHGEQVTVNGRTDDVWLLSDNNHWFAQAGTDGTFGQAAPTPPAPEPTPAPSTSVDTPPAPANNNGNENTNANSGDNTVPEVTPPAVQPQITVTPAPVKPGVKTTEFWLTLAVQAGALITLISTTAQSTPGTAWVKIVAVLGAVLSSVGYSKARATVKAAALTTSQTL